MLRQTALLIVSNPTQIGQTLCNAGKQVKNTLYIQLLSAVSEPFGNHHPKYFNSWPKFSNTVFNIYSQAARHCKNLDVRVLVSGLKYDIQKIHTNKPIDVVIFDNLQEQSDIDNFIATRVENVAREYDVVVLNSGESSFIPDKPLDKLDETICTHCVLGGTFDRLHEAHKLLLSEAALRSSKRITVGVTEENMIHNKILWELIEDVNVRMKNVSDFLTDICPEVSCEVVPISDIFGPSITDPTMEMIIVSKETIRGGEKINEIRKEKNMEPLKIIPIELIDHPDPQPIEEKKISSSTNRIRLLGNIIKPVMPNNSIPKSPYIIGLTGGIASGKSGVAKHLENLGAFIINADVAAHNVYKPGKPCYQQLVEHFGPKIVGENKEINRKALGEIVFNNSEELQKLNAIVWPAVAEEVNSMVKTTDKKVVVIEAALLLTAGWESSCHEVWTTLVPREEALRRLVKRNKLTEEQAESRINAQPTNTYYVKHSNVVFYPFWEVEYTKLQVKKAWNLLQERIGS